MAVHCQGDPYQNITAQRPGAQSLHTAKRGQITVNTRIHLINAFRIADRATRNGVAVAQEQVKGRALTARTSARTFSRVISRPRRGSRSRQKGQKRAVETLSLCSTPSTPHQRKRTSRQQALKAETRTARAVGDPADRASPSIRTLETSERRRLTPPTQSAHTTRMSGARRRRRTRSDRGRRR